MQVTGEYHLEAPTLAVWEMLNDVDVLRECIPGCESLEEVDDGAYLASVKTAIGPVRAVFKTEIRLENLQAPDSYTIVGETKGGAAGFGKGRADVTLAQSDGGTLLVYAANLNVGGKLAQIGSRLVVGATRKLADQFFDRFAELAGGEASLTARDIPTKQAARPGKSRATWWLLAAVAAVLALVLLLRSI